MLIQGNLRIGDGIINVNDPFTVVPSQASYTTSGTYSWVAPANVFSVSVVCVGGGGGGHILTAGVYGAGGGGGGLGWANDIRVTPGQTYTVKVGEGGEGATTTTSYTIYGANAGVGGDSYFKSNATVLGGGGASAPNLFYSPNGGLGGVFIAQGGGNGGRGGHGEDYPASNTFVGGGGGAGGYNGNGGDGADASNFAGSGNFNTSNVILQYTANGNVGLGGGGGGGGRRSSFPSGGGGGVGILGLGSDGLVGMSNLALPGGSAGGGGSNGANGSNGYTISSVYYGGDGGGFGGGGGAAAAQYGFAQGGNGAGGAVRIIWPGMWRQFPSTRTADE